MDHREEADQILTSVKAGRFRVRDHVVRRGDERLLSRDHIICIADNLVDWKWQEDRQTYWFIGFFEEDRSGGFTAIFDTEVWIVTVFKRRLTRREKGLASLPGNPLMTRFSGAREASG